MHIFEYILVLVRPQTDCLLFIHNQAKVMLERALECKFVVLSRTSTHHYLTKKVFESWTLPCSRYTAVVPALSMHWNDFSYVHYSVLFL